MSSRCWRCLLDSVAPLGFVDVDYLLGSVVMKLVKLVWCVIVVSLLFVVFGWMMCRLFCSDVLKMWLFCSEPVTSGGMFLVWRSRSGMVVWLWCSCSFFVFVGMSCSAAASRVLLL